MRESHYQQSSDAAAENRFRPFVISAGYPAILFGTTDSSYHVVDVIRILPSGRYALLPDLVREDTHRGASWHCRWAPTSSAASPVREHYRFREPRFTGTPFHQINHTQLAGTSPARVVRSGQTVWTTAGYGSRCRIAWASDETSWRSISVKAAVTEARFDRQLRRFRSSRCGLRALPVLRERRLYEFFVRRRLATQ